MAESDNGGAELAELATGAAIGVERALALQHVGVCGRCRQELVELARTADELLTLVPQRQPPPGFETSVLTRIIRDGIGAGRRTRGGFLIGLAAALVAAAFGAAVVWQSTAADRIAATEQRTVLAIAGGTHFTALPITTDAGVRAGTVFLYDGSPPWAMVSLTGVPVDGFYTVIIHGRDGTSTVAERCDVDDGSSMDAYRLARPVDAIASLELIGPGGVRLSARTSSTDR